MSIPCAIPLLALLLLGPGAAQHEEGAAAADRPPCERVLAWLRGEREHLAHDLELAHEALAARATTEAPALLLRLQPEPPRVLETGYGILPAVGPDAPLARVVARERTYSLEVLSTGFAPERRDAALLAGYALEDRGRALAELVTVYERLRLRLQDLDEHLAYHEHWQRSVRADGAWFAGRNALVARAREIADLRARGESHERAAMLERDLLAELAPFRPAPALRVERRPDGSRVLPVTVWTDVADERFLAAFREGVEAAYSRSEAARHRRFEIVLVLRSVAPADLGLERFPPQASRVDAQAHAERFPAGVLVLTTGAKSTHSWAGRSILLGPATISRRTLAHEFGHLLGFTDVYLRGYEGDPDGPFGVQLIEWTGLGDDLMGNPAGGVVTGGMIDCLIEAYGDA